MPTIQIPTYDHIDQILVLNSKYLITHLNDTQKKSGFVRIEYTEEEIKKIIEHQEIVVAIDNNKVVGYYLVGRKSDSVALDYQKNKAINLFGSHTIQFDKIGYGCQVCIDYTHRNNGLSKNMLLKLVEILDNKYEYLLSIISKENTISLQNSTAIGWTALDSSENPKYYYIKL